MPNVRISSTLPRGHRRAGLRFPREGAVIDPSTLTKEQIEAIQSDPKLKVEPVVEAQPSGGAGSQGGESDGGKANAPAAEAKAEAAPAPAAPEPVTAEEATAKPKGKGK